MAKKKDRYKANSWMSANVNEFTAVTKGKELTGMDHCYHFGEYHPTSPTFINLQLATRRRKDMVINWIKKGRIYLDPDQV
jgi:hypothetical protein